jgi:hypothetical protein
MEPLYCGMVALTKSRMTVDEFLAWAGERPGRYELFRGEVRVKRFMTDGVITLDPPGIVLAINDFFGG